MADKVEVIFVSSDRGRGDMFNYVRQERVMETSWQLLMDLRSVSHYPVFGVRGIPALNVVTNTREVVTRDKRQEVMSLGVSALATWSQAAPQPVDTSVVSMLADNTVDVMEAAKEVLVKFLSNIINDPNNSIEQSRCQIK